MTLSTQKPTREERAAMTKDEFLKVVWPLGDMLRAIRGEPIKEGLPKYDGEYDAIVRYTYIKLAACLPCTALKDEFN